MIDHLRAPFVALALTTACNGGKEVDALATTVHLELTAAMSIKDMKHKCGTTEGDFDIAAHFATFSGDKGVEELCPEDEDTLDPEACGTIGEEIIPDTEGRIRETTSADGEGFSDEWDGIQISGTAVTDNFDGGATGCLRYDGAFLELGEDIKEPSGSESSDELDLKVNCTWGPYEDWNIMDITDTSFRRLDCEVSSSTW